jgi:hypothetical protein
MVIWPWIAGFLLVGYLTLARSFAYFGIAPIFIGEVVLAAFLLLKPRIALGTWTTALLRPSPLNGLALALLAFMAYGAWQALRGILDGSGVVHTLKFFTFNYYTLYLFMGLWIALHAPDFLPKLIRIIAWVNGIYGVIYLVALRDLGAQIPGTDVPLFSAPAAQVIVILGLLCFERDLRQVWFVLLLNIVITLVWQVRAEWAGLAFGILAWGFFTGRLGRVVAIGMAGLAVLGLIELADIRLPGRNSEVSLSETLGRALAPIDQDLARQFTPHARLHAGTAEWREIWWDAIWRSVHSSPMLEAFGHGYGFPLITVAPKDAQKNNENDRTPHSIFYYALGYTGWVGVALYGALQLAIVALLWRSYRMGGTPAGLVFWVMAMVRVSFEEGFETPFKAIPFYLLWGMTMAAALQWRGEVQARLARARLPSAAGRWTEALPRRAG